ncbi:MAG: glycerophosphoryl diester phosphodiesterase [Magnetospirillum sp.]|nr:glycerophosphoryl diester phosphodiesterase [Magnetospirillum sp.]
MFLPPVIGHRGAAGLAPENTLASFDLAADLGCAMVEFDVRLSADQVPVVFHDDTLDRCTQATGPVASRTARQLQDLNIPSLAQVLELCLRRHLAVNIEIKPDRGMEAETARAALEGAGALWPSDRPPPLVSSFRRQALAMAQAVAPHWPRGLLYGRLPQGWRRHAEAFDCFSVHLDQRWASAERVARLRDAGLSVLAYTINRQARAEMLWNRGVSAVFSDRPDRLAPPHASDVMNF